jgi:hypothetical protein
LKEGLMNMRKLFALAALIAIALLAAQFGPSALFGG